MKSMTKECDILHDVKSVVGEICILMKFSPKREHWLGNISDNIEKEDFKTFKKLKKLLVTRWTVHAEYMKRIIDTYESLWQLWEENLEEKLDQETKARIVGWKSQMRSMRYDEDFDLFFQVLKKVANPIKPVRKPTLPRKQKKSNYSILQYVTGYEDPESNAYHPETAHDYFKPIYFQVLDTSISAINDRFEQPALKKFRNVKELLLKAINKADSSKELKVLEFDFC